MSRIASSGGGGSGGVRDIGDNVSRVEIDGRGTSHWPGALAFGVNTPFDGCCEVGTALFDRGGGD